MGRTWGVEPENECGMTEPLNGHCNCGNVRYQLNGAPLFTYVCHCSNCQRRSGSAFGMGLVVPISALDVEGELDCWQRVSDAGHHNPVYRCAGCGNVIYGVGELTPGLAKLQAGTLSDTQSLRPDVHIWTSSAQPWVSIPPDTLQYQEQPDNYDAILAAAADKRNTC